MRFLAGMILALAAISACGQTPQSGQLTLEGCIRLAQSAPSAVLAARLQAEIARYGRTQARAGFLPQSSIGNAFTYNSPVRGSSDNFSFIALNGIREYASQFSSGVQLDTSGRLRAGLARARADQDVAAANLGIAGRDLRRAVTAAYYRLLLTRHLVEVERDALAESQSFEKRSTLLAQHGEVAQADVIKASAQVAFLEQALQAADLEARLANHELASFWTAEVSDLLPVVDVLDQPPPSPETPPPGGAPFLRRLEFRLFDAQQRGFLADARRARADLLPQASLLFQYGLDAARLRIRDRGYASFLHFDIPVFDWFRARSAARQFRLESQQVEVSSRIAERAFSRDYRDALARVELIYSQIAVTQAQVRLSQDNLRLSRVRYEGGEGLALDVVAAQNQLAQARANYYAAKANYLNARADLEVAAGR